MCGPGRKAGRRKDFVEVVALAQAGDVEEQEYVRYDLSVRCETSSSDESLSTVAVRHRIAGEQRTAEHRIAASAQLEAKIAGGSDGRRKDESSETCRRAGRAQRIRASSYVDHPRSGSERSTSEEAGPAWRKQAYWKLTGMERGVRGDQGCSSGEATAKNGLIGSAIDNRSYR